MCESFGVYDGFGVYEISECMRVLEDSMNFGGI